MEGETLYTEKVVQYERWVTHVPFTYRYFEGNWPAYRAINAAGQEGRESPPCCSSLLSC
jgi:hypothetical protein